MSNLTKKWKAGNLERGFYYLRMASGNIVVDQYYHNGEKLLWANYIDSSIVDILAPVPQYKKWLDLNDYEKAVKSYDGKPIDYNIACFINELKEENKKLKEQLSEHQDYCCCQKNEVLLLENAKLKEFLKECKNKFIYIKSVKADVRKSICDNIIEKINEVLR